VVECLNVLTESAHRSQSSPYLLVRAFCH
jgi:hypothetical protein